MASKTITARREAQRFFKFLAVGAFGFVVDTGSLSALVFFAAMDRSVAKGVAFCLSVLSNFIWNRYWAYRESRSKSVSAQVLQFLLISVVGLAINVAVFGVVDRAVTGVVSHVLALYVAQVSAVGTALIWNFSANRLITYGDVKLGH